MTTLPITEDCIIAGLDMPTYHSQAVCDGPSVSSTGLRTVEQKSAAHFYASWSGNPDYEPVTGSALAFGSAAHALLLGDEEFSERHSVSPFDSFRTKDAREWRDAEIAQGRMVITAEDLRHIQGMAEVLSRHPLKDELLSGEVEQSVFFKDEASGLWVKSRMDVRPVGDTLVDLKTTADAHPVKCARSITDYRYDMQFALGAEALHRVAGQRIRHHLVIFQEKTPPYAVCPVEIDPSAIEWAARQNRRALDIIGECLRRGDWPGYAMPRPYHLPDFITKRLIEDEKGSLLPPEPDWLAAQYGEAA